MILYDLAARNGVHFSPNAWRVRMALAHKNLPHTVQDVLFTTIGDIEPGRKLTIPTLRHEGELITDSWAIVEYLDARFADRPRLIGAGAHARLTRFFQHWTQTTLHNGLSQLMLLDVYRQLHPLDQPYFRQSREARFGATLEALQAGRDERLPAFRKSLEPLRLALNGVDFVGGATPCYADYLAFGALQWARTSSPMTLLEANDVVLTWFERCLDLHDGVGRAEPAFVG